MTRIAVISDTHGNLTAFEAVLADIDARGIERIIHLGDYAGKGPRGAACCELARQRCEVTLIGNWDEYMIYPGHFSEASEWWKAELTQANRDWMASRPFSFDFAMGGINIRVFHASSTGVHDRIWPSMSDETWRQQFENTHATGDGPLPHMVLCADIHNAYKQTRFGKTICNTGSVGNSMDEPTASYVVLDDTTGDLDARILRIPYDIEAELAVAREVAMPDLAEWEQELRTAMYAR